MRIRVDPARNEPKGEGRKDGETVFSLVRERGQRPLSLFRKGKADWVAAVNSDRNRAALPREQGGPMAHDKKG